MTAHARLSPSAAHRWINCPASVKLSEVATVPDETFYADEGTRAHKLLEIRTKYHFKQINTSSYLDQYNHWKASLPEKFNREEMELVVDRYIGYVSGLADVMQESQVLVEQRVPTGIPQCWGTCDTVLVSPGALHVIDFKYGKGVPVYPENNEQLMLYTLGALDTFSSFLGEPEHVSMTIFQPRISSERTSTVSVESLRHWRRSIAVPAATLAMSDNPPYGPSEDTCRFCPVRGECKPRMQHLTRQDFGSPDLLSPADLSKALAMVQEYRNWCNDIEETAFNKIYQQGETIPGYKVVHGNGRRSIPDTEAAVAAFKKAGYPQDAVLDTKLKTLGNLESLVGKQKLPDILGDLMIKTEGKPVLTSENDSREAVSPETEARKDFGTI